MLGVMSRDCLANEHAAANTFEHSGGNMSNNQIMGDESKQMSNIYEFKAKSIDGEEVDLSKYKGSVMLIVNTASECGFTPQYAGLESLHEKFEARGLKVLGFPCNQFGGQEPGDSKDIAHFCQANYGVKFQMFEKVDVNGKDADPIFKYLTSSAPGILGSEVIKWNFTKFLLNKNGEIVKRFAPNVTPEDISPEIEKLL
jgi:glutathione peroxidase